MAMVVSSILISIAYASLTSARFNGRDSRNRQVEAGAMESGLEGINRYTSISKLQSLDSAWTESSQGASVSMTAKGSVPSPADLVDCSDSLATKGFLAKIQLKAWRTSGTGKDTLSVTTFVWAAP